MKFFAVILALTALSILASWYCFQHGYTLYYGDAEAHLNIARRVLDSRTPGPEQLGTVWLPLPHILMIPFAMRDPWWKNGLAGAIPSMLCFVAAGAFLFAAARREFSSTASLAAAAIFALNPNILYLQSTPMTEPLFAASLLAMLWATLWFRDSQDIWPILIAGAASNAASFTRYEGWFLILSPRCIFGWSRGRNGMRCCSEHSQRSRPSPGSCTISTTTATLLSFITVRGRQWPSTSGNLKEACSLIQAITTGARRSDITSPRHGSSPDGPCSSWDPSAPSPRYGNAHGGPSFCSRCRRCFTCGACIPRARRSSCPRYGRTATTTLATPLRFSPFSPSDRRRSPTSIRKSSEPRLPRSLQSSPSPRGSPDLRYAGKNLR